MKVTLDIDLLLADGRISQEEYIRLKEFSLDITTSLALNVVLAFGIIAVAGGTIALFQSPPVTITLGLILAAVGGYVRVTGFCRWKLLGNILLPLGALTGAGGIVAVTDGHVEGFAVIAGLFLGAGFVAQSRLLVSLSVFAILAALGGATGYEHAAYFLCIKKPLLTVVVFGFLAGLAYFISGYAPSPYSQLTVIFFRTAVVVVNFGFWVGSLWGNDGFDSIGSEWFFIIGWAVMLISVGVWAVFRGLRWLVNTTATFFGIHLYTQWFEHFNATPGSIIVAGVFTIVIAYALISYNWRAKNG